VSELFSFIQLDKVSQGLMTTKPAASKGDVSRVATAKPCFGIIDENNLRKNTRNQR
jgi:hypothetical protein